MSSSLAVPVTSKTQTTPVGPESPQAAATPDACREGQAPCNAPELVPDPADFAPASHSLPLLLEVEIPAGKTITWLFGDYPKRFKFPGRFPSLKQVQAEACS